MKYDGVCCPVCNEIFDSNSDVVVCPECGTPAHRACYEKNGGCINAEKHGDFVWVDPNKKEEKPVEKPTLDTATPAAPAAQINTTLNKENMPKNGVIGERGVDTQIHFREIKGNEKIGNYTVDDYAKVVDKNVAKFIPRFMMFDKTKRKTSWNWAAFFFGPFYLAYRKMYGYALLALLLIFFIPFVCFNEVTDYYSESFTKYSEALTSEAYSSAEQMDKAMSNFEANLPKQPFALTAASYVEMFVDVVCAVFANYLYMNHCTKVLDKAKDNENRDKYLKKHGGRSILGIVVLLVVFYIIALAIGLACNYLGSDLATLLRKFIK